MADTPSSHSLDYDAIIVGAGFGGCYLLYRLRAAGFKVLVIDEGADLGGVWYWNCYPGARVDSKTPYYEFAEKLLWKDWTWTQKYPSGSEIKDYFAYVDRRLSLKKDVKFNTRVQSATWNEAGATWSVASSDGIVRKSKWFLLCTGFAAKPLIPEIQGLDDFNGTCCHTSKWPQQGVEYKGKRVGVIGNGSSGLQVIQEVAPDVKKLTVFQRSPTYALPMMQTPLTKADQDKSKYPALYEERKHTFSGIDYNFLQENGADFTEQERNKTFEDVWAQGGLAFWLSTYPDVIRDPTVNRHAYDFWRSKVLPRIKDPKVAAILAPETPPYYFGTKRATLEQRYYEVYNQENVDLVNVKTNPITQVKPNGVTTADGVFRELDVLVLATGFDSTTGGILAIDIKGVDNISLRKKWSNGTYTNLGLMTAGFPNMIFLYGPQGPTAFCNGPTCAEAYGDWILNTLVYMREKEKTRLDSTVASEQEWRALVNKLGDATLLPQTASEYMGTNVPGKPKENLNYLGGFPDYVQRINNVIESDFAGFTVA